jgi:DNA mismatch repair protein MutL
MPAISILPEDVANRIAAGEVVERPASVVKELVENALDAGSSRIVVEVRRGGRQLIRVRDNGCGMDPEDAQVAFERHATSKIRTADDLWQVRTMGFRGEALAAIASVARMRLVTGTPGATWGTLVEVEGGKLMGAREAPPPEGTVVEVRDLFYNAPARLKFLRSPQTEISHISRLISRMALGWPSVAFRLEHGGRQILDLLPGRQEEERLCQVFGEAVAAMMARVEEEGKGFRIHGFASIPTLTRYDRGHQEIFINRRPVRSPLLQSAVTEAFHDRIPKGRHPLLVLYLDLEGDGVDVNVHPTKREVRFRDQEAVRTLVVRALRRTLEGVGSQKSGVRSQESGVELQKSEGKCTEAVGVREALASYGETEERTSAPSVLTDQPPLFPREGMPVRLLASLHDSFLLVEAPDGLWIIDQHAAHERVLYDRLQRELWEAAIRRQHLLFPLAVDLPPDEAILVRASLEEFRRIGFEVEEFGPRNFLLRAAPLLLGVCDLQRIFLDLVDALREAGRLLPPQDLADRLISFLACHPAVKIRHPLSREEQENLLCQLLETAHPETCPHGRPVTIKFSLAELERLLKRH